MKHISTFLATIVVSMILLVIFGGNLDDGEVTNSSVKMFGTVIIILLSFLIALVFSCHIITEKHK